MKRCPECTRDYYDETLSFCLDDGTRLVDGPASDESATALLPSLQPVGEAPTVKLSGAEAVSSSKASVSSAEYVAGEIRRHKKMLGLGVLAFLLLTGGTVFSLYKYWQKPSSGTPTIKIQR